MNSSRHKRMVSDMDFSSVPLTSWNSPYVQRQVDAPNSFESAISSQWNQACKRLKEISSCHARSQSLSDKFDDYYIMGPELGRGQFGVVRICVERRTGVKWACKVLSKVRISNPDQLEEINREIAILAHVRGHKNVVDLKAVFEDASNIYLIMDCCSGGELFDLVNQVGSFSETDAADIFRQLVDAVAFCHSKNVMHRDIKPENILLARNPNSTEIENEMLLCELTGRKFLKYHVKLADFGLALFLKKGQKAQGIAGSPLYLAPEVVSRSYDHSADIWSLGVILYILLCGSAPFCGDNDLETIQQIEAGHLDFSAPVWATVSPAAIDLICSLLRHDPGQRLTIEEILLHPWMLVQSISALSKVEREHLITSLQQSAPPVSAVVSRPFPGRSTLRYGNNMRSKPPVGLVSNPFPKAELFPSQLYGTCFAPPSGNQTFDERKLSMWS